MACRIAWWKSPDSPVGWVEERDPAFYGLRTQGKAGIPQSYIPAYGFLTVWLGSQIIRCKSRMFCNAGKHFGADFVVIMKGENEIRPTRTCKRFMGPGLPFNLPADA